MSRRQIALIYDDTFRPETTGTYCLSALRKYVDVQHFKPNELEQIPRNGFDLYLNIDDGLRYRLPSDLRPSAWWVIDTHMDLNWAIEKGHNFDWLFAAQRDGTEQLNRAGLCATWLPLACDPEIHRPWNLQNKWDICFVGRISSGPRYELLEMITRQFPRSFIGQCYFEEYARVCSESLIGFNRSVKNDVNMRIFETLGCGALLLTNDLTENGLEELFPSDRSLVTYQNADELLDKAKFYLKSDVERKRIAQAGHAVVLERHTYLHRMADILKTVSHDLNRSSVRVTAETMVNPKLPNPNWIDLVDFVIKTFLRPKALCRLLKSIEHHYPGAHVTIVDDGGIRLGVDPDSISCCRMIDSRNFKLLELPFASGVSAGRNKLVEQTRRPFLLFLDDDFAITDETNIERLFERIHRERYLGIAAGACVDVIHGDRRPRNSGGTIDRAGDVLEIHTQAWRNSEAKLREYVPQFMIIRREVFHEVSWAGEIGGEHYDFCLQLMQTRWKVAQDVSVVIDHYPLTETLLGYDQHRFDCTAAQQWLLRKWGLRRIVQDGTTIVELASDSMDSSSTSNRSSNGRSQKDMPYFNFARPEVVALIPVTSRRVLDIGCGAGHLGQLLKQRQSVEVVGLELQPQAADLARMRLDEVFELNVEESSVEFPAERFDCIVCADVLEHLREPAAVLSKIRRWLTCDGLLVASLPNVRHHSVVSGLLDGNWTYESAGLLDNDHVRFFTRREIEKLLYRQGYEIRSLISKPGSGHAEWVVSGRPGSVNVGSLRIEGLTPENAEEFFTYQFLVVAQPAKGSDKNQQPYSTAGSRTLEYRGLTSIIIVTHNELGYTKECIESIRFRTDEPYELIFVDNGSTDGTPQYLASLGNAHVIENPDNRGFPAAVNQGLKQARGNQVLLLNNDAVVTTGWLRKLLDALYSDPRAGMVGPTSNCVSGSQMVLANYSDMASADGFAWDWGKRHAGQKEETDRLIGFCLLIRKAVIEQIGFLDERFGIGCFEDDDLCKRASQAGWKLLIARDAFVHHYGSRTFASSNVDLVALMRENQRKFSEKWDKGDSVSQGQSDSTAFGITAAPGGGLLLVPPRVRLSLCMIVRNNETTIRPCLESIRPWVDEMIVVDTGSNDSTPAICHELGAQVYHWPWQDDFSAARNQSLSHAKGDWIFWMDSDDTISVDCGRKLRALAYGQHDSQNLGYVIQVHCPGPDGEQPPDVTVVDHVKLIRNRPDLRFEHRIHEQILPAIRRAGGTVAFTDLFVVHSGSDHSVEGRAQKLNRDFKLLHLDLKERPDHPFVLFNLGMTHADVQEFDQAIEWLIRCLHVSSPEESHVRKAYALLVNCLHQQSRFGEAQSACEKGRELYPDDKELRFRGAMLCHQLGRLDEAANGYREVLMDSAERHFTSVDVGLAGYKARHNLALVYEDQGKIESAEAEWRTILDEFPSYLPAQTGLVECLLKQRRFDRAEAAIGSIVDSPRNRATKHHLMARLFESKDEIKLAIERLQQGLNEIGNDPILLREQARLLYVTRDLHSAVNILKTLKTMLPHDDTVQNNLNVVMAELGHFTTCQPM